MRGFDVFAVAAPVVLVVLVVVVVVVVDVVAGFLLLGLDPKSAVVREEEAGCLRGALWPVACRVTAMVVEEKGGGIILPRGEKGVCEVLRECSGGKWV